MIKKLAKHGNSFALILDRPILELLNIHAETPLIITTDGHTLLITPVVQESKTTKFQTALENVNEKYQDLFQRLA